MRKQMMLQNNSGVYIRSCFFLFFVFLLSLFQVKVNGYFSGEATVIFVFAPHLNGNQFLKQNKTCSFWRKFFS